MKSTFEIRFKKKIWLLFMDPLHNVNYWINYHTANNHCRITKPFSAPISRSWTSGIIRAQGIILNPL